MNVVCAEMTSHDPEHGVSESNRAPLEDTQNDSAVTSIPSTMDSDTTVDNQRQANTQDTFHWEKLTYELRDIIFRMVHQDTAGNLCKSYY